MDERQSKIDAIRHEMNLISGKNEESLTKEELVIEQESVTEEVPESYEEPEIEIKIEDDDLNL